MDKTLFKNEEFAKELEKEFSKYTNLAYSLERDMDKGREDQAYNLDILSTSMSEIDDSEEGVLGSFVYWSKQDAKNDLALAEKLTHTIFEEI